MPYAFALLEAGVFILLGAAVTVATALFAIFRHLLGFAWRIWLWGSVGLIIGFVLAVALQLYFLTGVGISRGPPRQANLVIDFVAACIVFAPLVFPSLGIIFGCWYGWRVARRLRPAI